MQSLQTISACFLSELEQDRARRIISCCADSKQGQTAVCEFTATPHRLTQRRQYVIHKARRMMRHMIFNFQTISGLCGTRCIVISFDSIRKTSNYITQLDAGNACKQSNFLHRSSKLQEVYLVPDLSSRGRGAGSAAVRVRRAGPHRAWSSRASRLHSRRHPHLTCCTVCLFAAPSVWSDVFRNLRVVMNGSSSWGWELYPPTFHSH